MEQKHPYADIIHLPHHQAANRPHMSLYDRAAQFSPYAALVGYDDMVRETARETDSQAELGEAERALLDQKLTLISDLVDDGQHPEITVVYFVPDAHKDGGAYQEYTGKVKKVDAVARQLVFLNGQSRENGQCSGHTSGHTSEKAHTSEAGHTSGKTINLDYVAEIHGGPVDYMDEPVDYMDGS